MNPSLDDDELNFVIHQPQVYGETAHGPIIDHITTRQRRRRAK